MRHLLKVMTHHLPLLIIGVALVAGSTIKGVETQSLQPATAQFTYTTNAKDPA